jgi:hypothetical protein
MAPKAAQQAAKKKAAKQKKVLIACGVLLVIALIYAVVTLSSLGSHPAAAPADTTTTTTTPDGSTTPDATPAPAAVTPGITPPDPGYLHSFILLPRKDPFNDDGPKAASGTSGGSSGGSSSSSSSSSSRSSSGNSTSNTGNALKPKVLNQTKSSKKTTGPSKRAVISINGKKSTVTRGATFGDVSGQGNAKAFRLVSVATYTAVIALIGTKEQFTLNAGLPLTLKTKAWKFVLILEPNGSGAKKTVKRTAKKKH